ncbi:RloB family protein [Hymenobacter sp. YC55]|uniref:RloB family protein n=1 Tax=Hymenobacter sp. YC55 TaxID=3034019 RepID=UPI0023F9D583|nr:RloB family protein [Hymenobacter sp. YC55]MDF7809897.1 RloB family protein [Hymenobacter sp. YC55]
MRKSRGYKRETPSRLLRDYKVFAIACEGQKREPEYFNVFRYMSDRIKIDIIEDVVSDGENIENKSAPNWVLDRAMKYIDRVGLVEEDYLWFVIDSDRWDVDQIRVLAEHCARFANWQIVISNPCFEVWLYFHKRSDILSSASDSCSKFKFEISTFENGGYHPYKFIPYLQDAITNAKNADTNADHYLPEVKATKVYQLAEALLNVIGVSKFQSFLSIVLPKLIEENVEKARKSKKQKPA